MFKRCSKKNEIYLDNAATSYPKAPGMVAALQEFSIEVGASAGRGAYKRAVETGRIIDETRALAAKLINVKDPKRMIFTLNASDGLNMAMHGLDWKEGDRIIISQIEHNSIARPANVLKERFGVEVVKIPCSKEGYLDIGALKKAVNKKAKLIAMLHASNVLGSVFPIEEISQIAGSKGIPFLVDAAQSAGGIEIDFSKIKADMIAFPGHKSLLGPLGTGLLYISPGINLKTIKQGGTGSVSEVEYQPDFMPDKFEAGSHNALGIAGLNASLKFILKEGVNKIRSHKLELINYFMSSLAAMPHIKFFGPRKAKDQIGVISLQVDGWQPSKLAGYLYSKHGIMTRYGLHCAPGAHKLAGSFPEGCVRFSLGYFNTLSHIDAVVKVLRRINK